MTVHAKPCGFRTYLGNRFAIPTFPPPRRLLDSFHTKSRKELSSAIPSGLLQAHSSIRKDCETVRIGSLAGRNARLAGYYSAKSYELAKRIHAVPGPSHLYARTLRRVAARWHKLRDHQADRRDDQNLLGEQYGPDLGSLNPLCSFDKARAGGSPRLRAELFSLLPHPLPSVPHALGSHSEAGDECTVRYGTCRRLPLLQSLLRGVFLPSAETGNGSLPVPEVHPCIPGGRNSVCGRATMSRHLHSLQRPCEIIHQFKRRPNLNLE